MQSSKFSQLGSDIKTFGLGRCLIASARSISCNLEDRKRLASSPFFLLRIEACKVSSGRQWHNWRRWFFGNQVRSIRSRSEGGTCSSNNPVCGTDPSWPSPSCASPGCSTSFINDEIYVKRYIILLYIYLNFVIDVWLLYRKIKKL